MACLIAGCATDPSAPTTPAPSSAKPTLFSDVRLANFDPRTIRSRVMFAPAMVAIYVEDEDGGVKFDRALSSQGGDTLNKQLPRFANLADVRMVDLKLVAQTPLSGSEFYNRMDRATLESSDYVLRQQTSPNTPLWFGTPLSRKFSIWLEPLGADYVVFFKIVGAYRTQAAVRNRALAGLALGGILGAAIAGTLSSGEAISSAAVVDLRDGRMVWFKLRTYSDVKNIEAMRYALKFLVQDLFRDEAVSRIPPPRTPPAESEAESQGPP